MGHKEKSKLIYFLREKNNYLDFIKTFILSVRNLAP